MCLLNVNEISTPENTGNLRETYIDPPRKGKKDKISWVNWENERQRDGGKGKEGGKGSEKMHSSIFKKWKKNI